MIDFETYEADFRAREQAAKDSLSCFCVCEHNVPVERLHFTGRAGICPECSGQKHHGYPRRPIETYDWDAYEAANGIEPEPQSRVQRLVRRVTQPARMAEAVEYARSYGTEGFAFMVAMHERVLADEPLTDKMVEAILRSKAADKRVNVSAAKRIDKTEMKFVKTNALDLNRVFIGPDVAEGDYAVAAEEGIVVLRIERPTEGVMHGFTIVTAVVGDEVTRYGVQYPQPYRQAGDYRQTYRGAFAHLVHQLVSNPSAAKALYEEMA